MRYLKRRIIPPVEALPDKQRILSEGKSKRCVCCRWRWPVDDFIIEDGVELCPMCADHKTRTYQAEEIEKATRIAAASLKRMVKTGRDLSQFPLTEAVVGAVNAIVLANGSAVTQRTPLHLKRTVVSALLLNGVNMSAADTLSYPTGISDNVAPSRTSTQTTLSLIAAGGMTPGEYDLTFNGNVFRRILSVR